jgi:putative ABC transport system permease protein
VAENVGKKQGDTLELSTGGQTYEFTIIGIDDSDFEAIFIDWRTLAHMVDYTDDAGNPLPGQFYVVLEGSPSIEEVDAMIDVVSEQLSADGIQATYINQPAIAEIQAEQIDLFGVMFNITSGIMALVGAIGLMTTLSIAVFERQKEIGVMRSVGARSFTILSQFLTEGILVGVGAWIAAMPLSVALGFGFIGMLPFNFVDFTYPPQVLGLGFGGIVIVAAIASLWPSLIASRKTVAEILRYQ